MDTEPLTGAALDAAIRTKLDNDQTWLVASHPGAGLDEVDAAEVVAEHQAYQAALRSILERCDRIAGPYRHDHPNRILTATAHVIRSDIAKALHIAPLDDDMATEPFGDTALRTATFATMTEDEQWHVSTKGGLPEPKHLMWQSSNTDVATVETLSNGEVIVTGVSPGTCVVSAPFDGETYGIVFDITKSKLATLVPPTSTQGMPSLTDRLSQDFRDRVSSFATALRTLADTLETKVADLGHTPGLRTTPITASEIAADIHHALEWGLANAGASRIITAALNYDRATAATNETRKDT